MKYVRWIAGLFALGFGVPMFLEFFIFRNDFPSALSNGEWASFLGSFLGGTVSLIGILITIQFTQEENRKERELMYRPHIKVTECKKSENTKYLSVLTTGNYVENGKNCNIVIQIKNVGLGPILDFEIHELQYIYLNTKKVVPIVTKFVGDDIFEKDDKLELLFDFNLAANDNDLKNISFENTANVLPFLKYGGDLVFKISGNDICKKKYEKNIKIHVSCPICENKEKCFEYMPEAHLE